jgi:hypothetical protein
MNKKFDLIFISSCIDSNEIFNLIYSLDTDKTPLKKLLIVFNMSGNDVSPELKINYDIIIINENRILNSSQSRNQVVNYIICNNITGYYYAFPDDDSTYDFVFFNFMYQRIINFHKEPINLVFDVKCRDDVSKFYRGRIGKKERRITKYDFDSIGAVNIVVNNFTFLKLKSFDERYGVGSFFGAGEDGDYFLRGLNFNHFFYFPQLYTIHPSPSTLYKSNKLDYLKIRMFNYSRGVMHVLCSHKMFLYAIYISLRPLGPFIGNILKFNIKLALLFFRVFLFRIYLTIKFSFYV